MSNRSERGSECSAGFALDTGTLSTEQFSITGLVTYENGSPLSGATVQVQRYGQIFWSGIADATGAFASPLMASGFYTVLVQEPGHVPEPQSASPSNSELVFNLSPTTPAPFQLPTVREVAAGLLTEGEGGTLLGLDAFGQLAPVANLDSTRPTIVITHGWQILGAAPSDFQVPLALAIRAHPQLSQVPNIVIWDWQGEGGAEAPLPPIDRTQAQGVSLATALHDSLGANYAQPIHFIGHSLGTIVNRFACDSLHGDLKESDNVSDPWDAAFTQPHMTLLDEAELATISGLDFWASVSARAAARQVVGLAGASGRLLANRVSPPLNWKDPIPESAAWIDNYISLIGRYRKEAVNVSLPKECLDFELPSLFGDLSFAHGYAIEWYRQTAVQEVPSNGFSWSLAVGSDPATNPLFEAGELYYENLNTEAPFDIRVDLPDFSSYGDFNEIAPAWALGANGGFPIMLGLPDVGEQSMVMVGESLIGPMETVGEVIIEGVVRTGENIDAAWDNAVDFVSSIRPEASDLKGLFRSDFRICLIIPTSPIARGAKGLGGEKSFDDLEGPGAWLTVAIPDNAVGLIFDITVTGEVGEDVIVCAIEDETVFSLGARFPEPDSISSTDLIDVSQWSGQTVELFFGLLGGTANGAEVAVEGIRFLTFTKPEVEIVQNDEGLRLKWPALATGWELEGSSTLNGEDWTVMDVAPAALVNGEAVLSLTGAEAKEFFRLREKGE